MKFPFTIIRYYSRKNTPKRGRSGSNPRPKKSVSKSVSTAAEARVDGLVLVGKGRMPVIAVFDLDNPSAGGYSCALEAVTKSILEKTRMGVDDIGSNLKLGVDDIGSNLKFVCYTYQGRYVDLLVCVDRVKLLGVKAGETLVVLEKEDQFDEIGKYLKVTHGLNPEQFLYFSSPINYPIEHVFFSIGLVRDDMHTLFGLDSKTVKVFENVNVFVRLFCVFVVPSVFLEWRNTFSDLMKSDPIDTIQLHKDMVDLWKNWGRISDFISSGGITDLPESVRWLDLRTAKSLFSVLKPSVPKNHRGYHTTSADRTFLPLLSMKPVLTVRSIPVRSSLPFLSPTIPHAPSVPFPSTTPVSNLLSKIKFLKLFKYLPK